jgi:hypothetical protein
MAKTPSLSPVPSNRRPRQKMPPRQSARNWIGSGRNCSPASPRRSALKLPPRRMPAPDRVQEKRAGKKAEERAIWEQLAQDAEREKLSLSLRLETGGLVSPLFLQEDNGGPWVSQRAREPARRNLDTIIRLGEEAAEKIDLDEAATRQIVDQQLRDRGWDADTTALRYATGARPTKGRAMAIAEWPTEHGPADYALFVGLTCVGVVKASASVRMCPPRSTNRKGTPEAFHSLLAKPPAARGNRSACRSCSPRMAALI